MSDLDDEWGRLRVQLKPCPFCEAPSKDLRFKCAQMCATAWVYCDACGAGTPVDTRPFTLYVVYGEPGADSRPAAVEKWNAILRDKETP